VGFDEESVRRARTPKIARRFKTDHTHVQLTGSDLLAQLPHALAAMDQPTGDAVNTYVVAGAVRARGIKVALSGLGGDEIFGGYPSFSRLTRIVDLTRLSGRTPSGLRTFAANAVRALGRSSIQASKTAAVLESDGSLSAMFPLTRQLLSVEERSRASIENSRAHKREGQSYDRCWRTPMRKRHRRTSSRGFRSRRRTYMHDVLLRDTDQMSMAHALEVQVPLLDHRRGLDHYCRKK
jgi:asparagine synthase (glutamine-hydrolysing)